MQSFALGIVTRLFFAIFEPTGNIRCQSSGSQIFRGKRAGRPRSAADYQLLFKTRDELFSLFLQFLRNHTAERAEKRLVLGEFLLPFLVIDSEKVGDRFMVD